MTLAHQTRVLLTLPGDLLDRARVLAGQATIAFRLPVSLQIVLRALIGEGLKRARDPALLANVEGQAKAVRHLRRMAPQGRAAEEERGARRSGLRPPPGGRGDVEALGLVNPLRERRARGYGPGGAAVMGRRPPPSTP